MRVQFEGKDCHAHSAKAELDEPTDRELAVDVDHVAKGQDDEMFWIEALHQSPSSKFNKREQSWDTPWDTPYFKSKQQNQVRFAANHGDRDCRRVAS